MLCGVCTHGRVPGLTASLVSVAGIAVFLQTCHFLFLMCRSALGSCSPRARPGSHGWPIGRASPALAHGDIVAGSQTRLLRVIPHLCLCPLWLLLPVLTLCSSVTSKIFSVSLLICGLGFLASEDTFSPRIFQASSPCVLVSCQLEASDHLPPPLGL